MEERFLQHIPRDDIYLFNIGEARKAWLAFGCVFIPELQMHRFLVWAPNAKSVTLVGDFNAWHWDDTPMEKLMLFFVTQYEICHVNEKIRELFHFAYEDSEALSAVADFFKEDLRTALEQTYGKKMDDQKLLTVTTMGFCAMRGIIMSEYKGYAYEENEQIAYMLDLILYIYGIRGKDADALYARIEEAKPMLREATYNLIIYILQTKLL